MLKKLSILKLCVLANEASKTAKLTLFLGPTFEYFVAQSYWHFRQSYWHEEISRGWVYQLGSYVRFAIFYFQNGGYRHFGFLISVLLMLVYIEAVNRHLPK
jgi:hypothetical protein